MRKVFIDIGGHIGQTIEQFYRQVPDAHKWGIFSFEPICYSQLVKNTKKYANVHCIEAAVSASRDQVIDMFVPDVETNNQGSSIMRDKITASLNYDSGKLVNCINVVEWFNTNIQPNDFVIMKMNIEGAEYDIMPMLPALMSRINGLYIKLHSTKFAEPNRSLMDDICRLFICKNRVAGFKTVIHLDPTEEKYDFKKVGI